MKVILIDDEKAMLLIMKKMLSQIPEIEITGVFQNPEDAFLSIRSGQNADMAFIDIDLPGENGLELARRLLSVNPEMEIVFLTAHKEYALEAFNVYALDYIVKPASRERLQRTIQRAEDKRNKGMEKQKRDKSKRLNVYCFGRLEARSSSGGLIRWRSSKSAELFAYLLMYKGRCVTRVNIIEQVFSGMSVFKAATYLNTAVYQLRKSLELHGFKEIILSNDNSYWVDIKDVYIDYIDFENKAEGVVFDKADMVNALEIEKLYTGELFSDNGYLWSTAEREKLSEIYYRYAKRLGEFLLINGDLCSAERILKKLVNHNEIDEEANCLLMQVYAKQRDKAQLVSAYNRYAKLLQKELGISPSGEVVNLFVELRKLFA